MSFEEALSEVEDTIANLEKGNITLEESLEAYKKGTKLLAYCQNLLEKAEQEVSIYEQGGYKNFIEGVE